MTQDGAFQAGAASFGVPLKLLPVADCTLQALDTALGQLAQAVPIVKGRLLAAVVACIAADGQVTPEEGTAPRHRRRPGLSAAAAAGEPWRCEGNCSRAGGDWSVFGPSTLFAGAAWSENTGLSPSPQPPAGFRPPRTSMPPS